MKLLLVISICWAFLVGCGDRKSNEPVAKPVPYKYPQDGPPSKLLEYLEAGPSNAFNMAIHTNNYNFIGIQGYSVSVPGLSTDSLEFYLNKRQVAYLPGTGDEELYPYQRLYVDRAVGFASNYNRLLTNYIYQKGLIAPRSK